MLTPFPTLFRSEYMTDKQICLQIRPFALLKVLNMRLSNLDKNSDSDGDADSTYMQPGKWRSFQGLFYRDLPCTLI